MNNYDIILPLYFPFLYSLISFIDYSINNDLYHDYHDFSSKFKITFLNVFFLLPSSIFIILTFYPITSNIYSLYIEFSYIILNIIFYDIWFYTFHRILHTKYFYKFHKQHHELYDTIGIFALYGHPFDLIFVNIGSFSFLHIILNFSFFQLFLIITSSIYYTIIISHTGLKLNNHQIHHLKHDCNYGISIFMDKLFNTHNNNL
jgi:sterol desaturase/sphingolipid hydroxylase (fatty acid hydroxylase superfamily)